jgi:hypothetical protein
LNAYEARLLGVERQLMMIGRRANTLERETWAGLQDALQLWGEVAPGAAAPCPNTHLRFVAKGCLTNLFPGVAISATKGATTVTGTTDGAGVVTLDASAQPAGSWAWTATDPNGRLTGTSGTATTVCGTQTTVNTTLGPALSGYTCNPAASPCAVPTTTTLTLQTPFGNVAIPANGSTVNQTITPGPTVKANCPGGSNCAAAPTAGGNAIIQWHWTGSAIAGTYGGCFSGGVRAIVDSAHTQCFSLSLTIATTTPVVCPPSFLYQATVTDPFGLTGFTGQTVTLTE